MVIGGRKCAIYGRLPYLEVTSQGGGLGRVVGCGVNPMLDFGLFDPERLHFI